MPSALPRALDLRPVAARAHRAKQTPVELLEPRRAPARSIGRRTSELAAEMRPVSPDDRLADYEHGFRRAGLPLLIEGFSASTDVFNRAAPLLALVFLGEMLGAIQLDWSLLGNIAAALGGLGDPAGCGHRPEPCPRAAAARAAGGRRPGRAGGLRRPARAPAADLRRAVAKRRGHRRRQPRPAGPDLRRGRLRPALDRALGVRAALEPARFVAGPAHARDPAADDLLGGPLPDRRDVGGVLRPAAGVVRDPRGALRRPGHLLSGRPGAPRGALPGARGRR